jgi:cation diffusion facilitator CzcD-associated flavoprotein CzcO
MKRAAGQKNGPEIAIAGCGFGGIAMAVALKQAGFGDFTIYEKSGDVGGVWRDNAYPGAACDVPSRLYSLSFAQDFPWSARYAPQREIHAYLRQCVERYDLTPHLRLNTGIAAARFDEARGRWLIETTTGERREADVFISAVGLFDRPALPDIPGRSDFKGPQFHSARWDHSVSLAGKTVAVIGTGASAIQFVPAIAPEVEALHVFQRSAQYVLPKPDGPVRRGWWRRPPLLRSLERLRVFLSFERIIPRRSSERLTAEGQAGFLEYLETAVPDPDLRRKLTPDYTLGCKRVLISNDWYPALQRPNVELVDSSIEAILPKGIRAADGQVREVDVIVYGTGFTPTDFLSSLSVTGLGGRALREAWRGGAEAYLGITVAGFPNFFMLYGPNTNTSGSIVYMLESQARYIVSAVRTLGRRGSQTMTLRPAVQRRYNVEIQRRIAGTVLVKPGCRSYFQTVAGKVTTQWPGHMFAYRWRTRRAREADYELAAAPQPDTPAAAAREPAKAGA